MSPFPVQLADAAARVDAHLTKLLDNEQRRGAPERLVAAMRHATLGGGKRFRPFLALSSAALFDVAEASALSAAAAIELVHCYSLVHDDLPCMDNDETRRGQPTVWKAFDEWTAILAGDALQGLAFEILVAPECHDNPAVCAELVRALASAAGAAGMVGGQVLDLEADKLKARHGAVAAEIARLQAMKTGRLIAVACEMGAIVGEASEKHHAALSNYGKSVGAAFQISDDLLDAEGRAETVGKATGKDAAAGKATLVSLLGVAAARAELEKSITEAVDALAAFGASADPLRAAARFMSGRGH
ncbi:MAG: polyprenyl synthetase family protein [Hyphomicrobium sp.]